MHVECHDFSSADGDTNKLFTELYAVDSRFSLTTSSTSAPNRTSPWRYS